MQGLTILGGSIGKHVNLKTSDKRKSFTEVRWNTKTVNQRPEIGSMTTLPNPGPKLTH